MEALQLIRPRHFQAVESPVPELPQEGSVLVKQKWALVCGSDVPHFTGKRRSAAYPFPVGRPIHECVGKVVATSSPHFAPGELVLAIPLDYRGLAEYFVAPSDETVVLPSDLEDCDASTLIQPLATVMYGVDRLGTVQGQAVAVIGLGPIGLMFCWLLRRSGAAQVTGVDPNPWRCSMARELGADEVFPMRSIELVHRTRVGSDEWEPPDICVEAVGHQRDTINDCLELVRWRGVVLAFGVPDDMIYPIEFELLYRKNLELRAAVAPSWTEYLAEARDLFCRYRQELEPLVTHRFPMSEAEQAYALAEESPEGVGKVLLDASEW